MLERKMRRPGQRPMLTGTPSGTRSGPRTASPMRSATPCPKALTVRADTLSPTSMRGLSYRRWRRIT